MTKHSHLRSFLINCLFFSPCIIFSQTWVFDDAHSNLQFSLSHMMVTEIEGSLKIREATLASQGEDFSDASVRIIADMNSIDTDNEGRDEHLRSKDFFDTEKFPEMLFVSNSFSKTEENTYKVSGDLTFHGITRPVVLDAIATVAVRPYDHKTIVGFKVKGEIRRTDFDISTETPGTLLGNEVSIKVNAIFVKE